VLFKYYPLGAQIIAIIVTSALFLECSPKILFLVKSSFNKILPHVLPCSIFKSTLGLRIYKIMDLQKRDKKYTRFLFGLVPPPLPSIAE
jgi:hypothetical protein